MLSPVQYCTKAMICPRLGTVLLEAGSTGGMCKWCGWHAFTACRINSVHCEHPSQQFQLPYELTSEPHLAVGMSSVLLNLYIQLCPSEHIPGMPLHEHSSCLQDSLAWVSGLLHKPRWQALNTTQGCYQLGKVLPPPSVS